MRELLSFLRRDALVAASYRLGLVLSLASLLMLVIPLFFIAKALQPVVGASIAMEGRQYFAFLIVGMATFQFVTTAVGAIPTAVASGLRTGTFESLLATPARLPLLLAGMLLYPFLWTIARAVVLLLAGWLLGAEYQLTHLALALPIWGLVVLAYVPFGLLASAMLLVARTTGPFPNIVIAASMFLGGVYYPTSAIPSWLGRLSDAVPLTYGLRALRRTLAGDAAPGTIALDVGMLALLAGALLGASMVALRLSLVHARRRGTLAQY